MRLLLLAAAITLSTQGFASPLGGDSLKAAPLNVSKKSDVLEFQIGEHVGEAKEVSHTPSNNAQLAHRSFTDPNISGYACNISHTPSETNKWSIILYNLSDPQDDGEVVFSVNKNRKIQSVACLPNGEQLIFSVQETTQGDTEVYSLDLLTNQITRLTDNDTDDNDVSISQDGRVMAWQKRLADGRQAVTIRTYGETGNSFTEKSLASANPFVQPSLSANGEWLALVQLRTNNFLALRYDVTNNSFKTIHTIPRRKRLFHPSVSADGNLYTWVENKAQSKFVVKNISANTITKLVTGVPGIEHPYLAQNGESVMYSIGEQTLIKNLSTGATEEVNFATRFLGSYWMGEPEPPTLSGSWEFPGEEVILHFLPDGRYFAKQWESEYDEGFEYGTYAVSGGEITFTTLENQGGDVLTCWYEKGVSCDGTNGIPASVWPYSLTDDELSLTVPDEDREVVFNRIESSDSPFDGLWESLDAKEIVFFMGGDTYFYIDYLNDDPGSDIVFDLGKYTITSENGDSFEVRLDTSHTYNYELSGPVCEQFGNTPCESATYSFSKVNGQLVVIDPEGNDDGGTRGYYNQLLVDDGSPADTAKLVAQKDYASDVTANQDYGVEINDDYRTRIRTNSELDQASSVSSKFNIDDASTLVRNPSGASASLRTRLTASYAYPGNENRDVWLALNASVRLRSFGGSASAKYVVDTCFDNGCDNEVYIEGFASNLGTFTGDHEMAVKWDNSAQAFAFMVDGSEVGRITMAQYNSEASAYSSFDAAAGNYTFNPADFYRTEVRLDVQDVKAGESGYLAVHLDEVKIDDEVYDDFKNGLIDSDKWSYQSEER